MTWLYYDATVSAADAPHETGFFLPDKTLEKALYLIRAISKHGTQSPIRLFKCIEGIFYVADRENAGFLGGLYSWY